MATRWKLSITMILFLGIAPAFASGAPVEAGAVIASFEVSASLNDVQVFPQGEIVGVGNLEALHVDGFGVNRISHPYGEGKKLIKGFVKGIWGAAPDNVWAVNSHGHILHWNGRHWSIVDEGPRVLLDIWGSSPDDIFAVGRDGVVLHFDGVRWSSMSSGTDAVLVSIWGSSSKDVWVVGEGDTMLHYDGSAWRRPRVPTNRSFGIVTGTASNDIFVAGWGGACYHFDGTAWKEIDLGTRGVVDIAPTGDGRAWAVTKDQGVLRFNGRTWSRSFSLPDQFYAMSSATTPTGALVVVGFHGNVFDSEKGDHSVISRDGALLVMATGSPHEQIPN